MGGYAKGADLKRALGRNKKTQKPYGSGPNMKGCFRIRFSKIIPMNGEGNNIGAGSGKPAVQNSIPISHMGSRTQVLKPSSTTLIKVHLSRSCNQIQPRLSAIGFRHPEWQTKWSFWQMRKQTHGCFFTLKSRLMVTPLSGMS